MFVTLHIINILEEPFTTLLLIILHVIVRPDLPLVKFYSNHSLCGIPEISVDERLSTTHTTFVQSPILYLSVGSLQFHIEELKLIGAHLCVYQSLMYIT